MIEGITMNEMVYVYIFAIAILLVIHINLIYQNQTSVTGDKAFRRVVFFTAAMMGIDFLHEHFNGLIGTFNEFMLRFLSVVIFALPSYLVVVWFNYAYQLIYKKTIEKNRAYWLFLIPMFINIILSIASLIYPFYFGINADNTYTRGNIYAISLIFQFFYLIVPIYLVLTNKKRIYGDNYYAMIFFVVIPIIGGIIQALNYGILIIWPSIAFAIFIGYIFIQSKLIATDHLTGLNNRGAFENYLEHIKTKNRRDEILTAAIFDLDNLKQFNDKHGHLTGDEVLKTFSQALMDSFNHRTFLARIGGDEFIALMYVKSKEDLKPNFESLGNIIDKINERNDLPDDIQYSYGYAIYQSSFVSVKDFIDQVDKNMYLDKDQKTK
jgi:diguanylate cyclase (GGDEF)-like protein